jgi:pimeloyl-ACP methyl ester carboxylesterase
MATSSLGIFAILRLIAAKTNRQTFPPSVAQCGALIGPLFVAVVIALFSAHALALEPFADARFTQVISRDGVPLNVIEKGDPSKPPILFVHGFRQSYLSWSAQFASALSESCHLVAFDLRGHGNSGSPWKAESYDNNQVWADDVQSVIRATGLRNPYVVGWSFGGNVLMSHIRQYPAEKFSGILLVSTGAGTIVPKHGVTQLFRPTQSPDLAVNIGAIGATNDLFFAKLPDRALAARFAAASMRVSPFVDKGIVNLFASSNADLLPKLSAPVTLLLGGKDPIISNTLSGEIKKIFEGKEIIEFAESGHAPFLDETERFNKLLMERHCKKGNTP